MWELVTKYHKCVLGPETILNHTTELLHAAGACTLLTSRRASKVALLRPGDLFLCSGGRWSVFIRFHVWLYEIIELQNSTAHPVIPQGQIEANAHHVVTGLQKVPLRLTLTLFLLIVLRSSSSCAISRAIFC